MLCLFFTFLFSLLFWAGESVVLHKPMSLPTDASFWGSVIYISFFIRGLYGIVQIYALRYVSPLNTSLIFSSEIIMTMFMSPILTLVMYWMCVVCFVLPYACQGNCFRVWLCFDYGNRNVALVAGRFSNS